MWKNGIPRDEMRMEFPAGTKPTFELSDEIIFVPFANLFAVCMGTGLCNVYSLKIHALLSVGEIVFEWEVLKKKFE